MKRIALILLSILRVFNCPCNAQWSQMNGLFNDNVLAYPTYAVAIDSIHIIAATESGLYLSSDDGANWQRFSSGLAFNTATNGEIGYQCLVWASPPQQPLKIKGNDVYYCSGNNILHTTLTSGIWVSHSITALSGTINDYTCSDSSIFIATNSGVYTSTDNGATFQTANNGLTTWNGNIFCNTIYYKDGKLFVSNSGPGNSNTLLVSYDNGLTWNSLHSFGSGVGEITCIMGQDSMLLAGTLTAGVYVSTDNGGTWAAANIGFANMPNGVHITSLFRSENKIFATTQEDTYVTDSVITSWTDIHYFNGTGSSYNSRVALVSQTFPSYNIIDISNDSGTTWKSARNTTLVGAGVADIAMVGNAISVSQGSIQTTYNEGNSWSTTDPLGTQFSRVYESSIIAVGGKFFRSSFNQGNLEISGDTGQTWSFITNVTSLGYQINGLATDGNNIYAATFGGIYKSTDLGSTWNQVSVANVAHIFCLGTDVYTSSISKSTDGGQSWNAVNFNIPQFNTVTSICKIGNDIFLGTEGYDNSGNPMSAGVFKSFDNGVTWTHLFTHGATTAMLSVNGLVFAATTDPPQTSSYIYMSADSGNTWNESDSGMGFTNSGRFQRLVTDGNNIYCGTSTHGLWQVRISNLITGVNNIYNELLNVKIYPNPSNGFFNIALTGNMAYCGSIKLIDMLGKTIFVKQLASSETKIDLTSQLSPGIYAIQIFSQENNLVVSKKIIIE